MEKNNDMTRSIVLRKSNNWDSPAEIIRAEHTGVEWAHFATETGESTLTQNRVLTFGVLESKPNPRSLRKDVSVFSKLTLPLKMRQTERNSLRKNRSRRKKTNSKSKAKIKKWVISYFKTTSPHRKNYHILILGFFRVLITYP